MYQNIPAELRALPQFVTWRYELLPGAIKPTKPLYNPKTGWHASSTDSSTWVTFDDAVAALQTGHYSGIGFVMTERDPYTFIDLDTYDPTLTADDRARHQKIAHAFDTYAELSPSGQGLHIIAKGEVPTGRRRAGIEVYSSGRYMTMTGNVWRNTEIKEQQELLTTLWDQLAPETRITFDTTTNEPQTEADNSICDKAFAAINGEKFKDLYLGNWQAHYPSQSQADFALINIIAFYTKNREQIMRIFKASALGQRTKAERAAYVLPMISRAFDNQQPPIDYDKLKQAMEAVKTAKLTRVEPVKVAETQDVYRVPLGLVGEVAKYIYQAAPRQVPEIALCAALGLMAGICGRSFNISGTGLNHYFMLLAPTGSGKESMASGIAKLMGEVQKVVPSAMEFVGPGEIRSDAALLKYIAKKSSSFVTIGGEFGHTLQQMAALNGSSVVKGIKRTMLDLYGKSGRGSVLRPTIYSDADKNTMALNSPAFSFIGESAPESFYNSVDEALVSDGMLPRFTLIEYSGIQPALNPFANGEPPKELVTQIASLCANSLNLNNAGKCVDIRFHPEAQKTLDDFEVFCRDKINAPDNQEVIRHIWNRAHLRALKLAGLLAVGEHPYEPMVSPEAALWAVNLSSHNTQRLLDRFESGEVGMQNTDDKHIKEVMRICSKFLYLKASDLQKYPEFYTKMHASSAIPYSYIQQNLIATAAFRTARVGGSNALKTALGAICSNGDLIELQKLDSHKRFGSTAICYVIQNPTAFRRKAKAVVNAI